MLVTLVAAKQNVFVNRLKLSKLSAFLSSSCYVINLDVRCRTQWT